MTTPTKVFKNFERADLLHIIKYRNIEVVAKLQDEPDKDLVKLLAEDVSGAGLLLLFESLDKETLTKITKGLKLKYKGYEDKEDYHPSVAVMAKRLLSEVSAAPNAKHWFTHDCADYLEDIIDDEKVKEDLEDVSAKDKAKAALAIIGLANSLGVENCLSAFDVDTLKRFAEGSGLAVYGRSFEKILNALIDASDMEKPKAPKKKIKAVEEEASETKPKIAKGISKVDLNSWYYAVDLQAWCKDHDLPYNLTKKLLIKQILDFLDGKEIPKKEKKEKKTKKKAADDEEPKKKKPKRRTRAPIGQAKRPKRKPKKKKQEGAPEGEPPAKKQKTETTTKKPAAADSEISK